MGLDMYLNSKRTLYPDYKDGDKTESEQMQQVRRAFPEMWKSEDMLGYIEVMFEAGYWRKANHIHKWFVDNVQNGTDNCGNYYVSREKLQELKNIVCRVLESSKLINDTVVNGYMVEKDGTRVPTLEDGQVMLNTRTAEELLPCSEGFFFGSTDYDQWYYNSLIYTKELIEKCLNLPDVWSFEYGSSW
jgi:hypothetical protein